MIASKKPNPSSSSSKGGRIGGLADYIEEEREKERSKCTHEGALNMITDSIAAPDRHRRLELRKAEMEGTAEACTRSKNPIDHWVLSWAEGERPTNEQVDDVVKKFADGMGWKSHQIIYAVHSNTDNVHVHLVVNRVDPVTLKCVSNSNDYDRANKVKASIEIEYGWSNNRNDKYIGKVITDMAGRQKITVQENKAHTEEPKPTDGNRRREHETGERSAERIAIEDGGPIINQAIKERWPWQKLHVALAKKGMSYEAKGSGAALIVRLTDGQRLGIKASKVLPCRAASLQHLVMVMGKYEAPGNHLEIRPTQPGPVEAYPSHRNITHKLYKEFVTQKSDYYARLRATGARQKDEGKAITAKYQAMRQRFHSYPQLLKRVSEMAREERARTKAKYDQERVAIHNETTPSWDTFLERKANANDYAAQALLSYRRNKKSLKLAGQVDPSEDQIRQSMANEVTNNAKSTLNTIIAQDYDPVPDTCYKTALLIDTSLKMGAVQDKVMPTLAHTPAQDDDIMLFQFKGGESVLTHLETRTMTFDGPDDEAIKTLKSAIEIVKEALKIPYKAIKRALAPQIVITPKQQAQEHEQSKGFSMGR